MKPSLWQKLDGWARRMTPVAMTLLLVVINVLPTQIPGFARVTPLLALIAIYHWTIYRPDLMPAVAIFMIGAFQDLMTGTPPGVHALVFLVVYGAVVSQRRFLVGKSFVITWLGFAVVGGAATLLIWMLVSAFYFSLLDPRALAYQYLLTLGVFPVLGWAFLQWQRAFLRPD